MRLALILSTLLLTACGFTPMHGASNQQANKNFDSIDIAIIPDREGQFLRNALMDRFYTGGIPSDPTYQLKVSSIKERTYNFDITVDSEATRRQLKLDTTMRLVDLETKKTIIEQALVSIASYNVLQSEFSTIVTEQSARENALHDLARQIERQIILYQTQ